MKTSNNTAWVSCNEKSCKGRLGCKDEPFSSADDAVIDWIKCHDNSCSTEQLNVLFSNSCTTHLRLVDYKGVNFVGLVPGVVLVSYSRVHREANNFTDTTFTNITHQIIANGSLPTNTTTETFAGITYSGQVTYDEKSSIVVNIDPSQPSCTNFPIVRQSSANNGRVLGMGLPTPLGYVPRENFAQRDNSALADAVARINFNNAFLLVAKGATVDNQGPLIVNSRTNTEVAIFRNEGILTANPRVLNYYSGFVIVGSGTTRLYGIIKDGGWTSRPLTAPGVIPIVFEGIENNRITTYNVQRLAESAIVATSGPIFIDDLDIIVTPTQPSTVAQRNNERPLFNIITDTNAFLFVNTRLFSNNNSLGMSLTGGRDQPLIVNNNTPSSSPQVQIRNGSINGTNSKVSLFATNDRLSVIVGTDFISSKPYPAVVPEEANNTGPLFALFGSSSPVWNGSWFLNYTLINNDYTHTRLDGVIFYIDASSNKRESVPNPTSKVNPTSLECKKDTCTRITITLPSGSTSNTDDCDINAYWDGRIVWYKRIDCSRGEVEIKLNLEGHNTCLSLEAGQAVMLQNVLGRYYILSRVPRYQL